MLAPLIYAHNYFRNRAASIYHSELNLMQEIDLSIVSFSVFFCLAENYNMLIINKTNEDVRFH